MIERIDSLRAEASAEIATAPDVATLEELRIRHLGRGSELTGILRGIGELEASDRGPVGSAANAAPSRAHWNVVPPIVALNWNVADVELVVAAGFAVIVVSGGVEATGQPISF